MYVVGVSGSPRKAGNTAILVNEILRHVKARKKFVSLANLNTQPCRGCNRCWKESLPCLIKDDITWILEELKKCDAMILGSPAYFGSMSAQLKMLVDRSVSTYVNMRTQFVNKILAGAVTQDVYGEGRGGELTLSSIRNLWGGDVVYAGGVIGEGGSEIGNIKKDKRAMQEAKELAARIMELYEAMKRK